MARFIPEEDLPVSLDIPISIGIAYSNELSTIYDSLSKNLPVLVECEKGMTLHIFNVLRNYFRQNTNPSFIAHLIDGRTPPPGAMPSSFIGNMLATIVHLVRGGTQNESGQRNIFILPHLDLLTTVTGALTSEAREAIALMYENPNNLWMGFKDPSFQIPKTIQDVFPRKVAFLGIPRNALYKLVTQAESRKLGRDGLDVYQLYKSVSGLNVLQLRRLLSSLDGEDYPQDSKRVWAEIRKTTVEKGLELPDFSLERDIGGYLEVKSRIKEDIIDLIQGMDGETNVDRYEAIEKLIPKGMLFWGPPGTGKTLFAKAIASSLGAAIQVVNGPELKSRWVGESEENLRKIFLSARQSAPSVIVFDEIDSFASQRGTYAGSGVEHSMVNQLLTEMDGFRSNEMVFVIGTTNFVESVDSALLRPGRFEFHLHIPYPREEDRREILKIYNKSMSLSFEETALNHAVRETQYPIGRGFWSGDHLEAFCRTIARDRLRSGRKDFTTIEDVEKAFNIIQKRPKLTEKEKKVIAIHECGHAIVGMYCKELPPVERISIGGNLSGALGMVQHKEMSDKNTLNLNQLFERIVALLGATIAEENVLKTRSMGAHHDLESAAQIARILAKMGYDPQGTNLSHVVTILEDDASLWSRELRDETAARILKAAAEKATQILEEHQKEHEILVEKLLRENIIEVSK